MAYGEPYCAACGKEEDVIEFALAEPRQRARSRPTVFLCTECRGNAYGRGKGLSQQEAAYEGIQRAKAAGKKLGRPFKKLKPVDYDIIDMVQNQGIPIREVARRLEVDAEYIESVVRHKKIP
jgi:transposase-like protein